MYCYSSLYIICIIYHTYSLYVRSHNHKRYIFFIYHSLDTYKSYVSFLFCCYEYRNFSPLHHSPILSVYFPRQGQGLHFEAPRIRGQGSSTSTRKLVVFFLILSSSLPTLSFNLTSPISLPIIYTFHISFTPTSYPSKPPQTLKSKLDILPLTLTPLHKNIQNLT